MKVTYPHLGNSYICIEVFLRGLGYEPITPPLGNKRTLELGNKLSPEQTCLPFKIILGNMLEGLDLGAEGVFMLGGWGPCRLGYYGETQRLLLEEAGYRIEFLTIEVPRRDLSSVWQLFRTSLANSKPKDFWHGCHLAWAKLEALETLENCALDVRPREKTVGSTSGYLVKQLQNLRKATTISAVRQVCSTSKKGFGDLLDHGKTNNKLLKIGIVGEIYTVVESFANLNLEERLGHLGVQVVRTISLREWLQDHIFKKIVGLSHLDSLTSSAEGYLRGFIGGHGLESVARSVDLAGTGLNGIIHIFPMSCMPEVVAQGILPQISADHHLPIMSLIVDEHSSETGFQTRLEAFVDLCERRMQVHVCSGQSSIFRG